MTSCFRVGLKAIGAQSPVQAAGQVFQSWNKTVLMQHPILKLLALTALTWLTAWPALAQLPKRDLIVAVRQVGCIGQ